MCSRKVARRGVPMAPSLTRRVMSAWPGAKRNSVPTRAADGPAGAAGRAHGSNGHQPGRFSLMSERTSALNESDGHPGSRPLPADEAIEVVRRFLHLLQAGEIDVAADLLATDVRYV